jgi:hypothetical protein
MVTNLLGDMTNVVLGTGPRAIVSVPIAAAILVSINEQKVREFFSSSRD